jgi:hypothetical protein
VTLRTLAGMASIGFALASGVAACGSSSSSGTGGTGGAAGGGGSVGGTKGTAGSPGTGGTGGGAVSCGDLPACVASVVAPCPLASTSCVVAASGAGNVSTHDICFGNGVKAVNAITNDPNTGAGSTSISVTKSGVVCYTLDGTFNSQDPVTTPRLLSFKNASGVEVATFATDISIFPNTTTVTCTGGQPVPVANFGNCGKPNIPEPDQCIGGSCTAP